MAPKAKAKVGARSRSNTPSAAKAKAKGKAKAKANASFSPQDLAVIAWQVAAKRFLSQAWLTSLLAESVKNEKEMNEAIRAAEFAVFEADRRKMEAERKKESEKRKKAKQLAEDVKKLLASAFDGEIGNVLRLLDAGLLVNSADALGTTALSEAASGGFPDVAKLLLERTANPNCQGEFKRTPLWRACYASHVDMVQLLLESGGDPRLTDDQSQMPLDVTSKEDILACLRAWDLSRTDEMVEEYESWAEDLRLEAMLKQKEALRSVENEYETAQKAHEAAQMMLAKAKSQMRNRVKEYGIELAAGNQRAREACASADEELVRAESEAASAQVRFDQASIARMVAAEEHGITDVLPGREVVITELNNVLLRDLGSRIRDGTHWPIVIDLNDCAKKLLYYSGCAVLNFFKAEDMDPDRLRMALLSMIRAGGVLALDLFCFAAGVDRDLLAEPFERIRPGLLARICDRSLLRTAPGSRLEAFHELITKEEKANKFRIESFDAEHVARFKLMILTSSAHPHRDLLDSYDVVRVGAARGFDT